MLFYEKLVKRHIQQNFMEEIMKRTKSNIGTKAISDVLFQKMGSTWYVFTEVKGEMIYSPLPDGMDPRSTKLELFEVIEEHMSKIAKERNRKPEAAA